MRAIRRTVVREVAAWVITVVLLLMWWAATTQTDPRTGESTAPDLILPSFVLGIVALVWAITETRMRRSDERVAIFRPKSSNAPKTPPPGGRLRGVTASWRSDPTGRYELRYWDGSAWTDSVASSGRRFNDPVA